VLIKFSFYDLKLFLQNVDKLYNSIVHMLVTNVNVIMDDSTGSDME
jgi:hypothetical protein